MPNNKEKNLTALVIGAGFSGIGAAIQLSKQLGITADIIEHSSEVGGTWHSNTYPDCACDIQSHLYSFSFELNPDWSQSHSPQPEIYAYLQHVAKKYDLYKSIQLNTTVLKAEWCKERNQWKVDYAHNDHYDKIQSKYYDFLFSGIGGLRIPKIPKQLEGFSGTAIHTAQWDSNIDFTNKRVGIIGNGASAVQVLPFLQKKSSKLYNFQRTPSWVGPRQQTEFSNLVKFCFRWIPFVMRFYRWYLYWTYESRFYGFKYPDSKFAKKVTQLLAASISSRLVKAGKPDLASSLIPNYAVGCKRFLASDTYYETLAQDNVTVVPAGVDKIEGNKLWAGNSAYEVDILVLATGFEIQHPFGHLDIIGKNGISLKDLWKNEPPKTYKTVMMHGYPNFFHMLGPGAALGHNSVVAMIECQINFGIDCIKNMKRFQLNYIEPKKDAQEKFSSDLKNDLKSTVWLTGGCKSWYQNDNSGSVNLWSGTVTSFWWNLRNPTIKDFVQGHESKKLV
ncbi:putative flavo protein [Absidia repens]|uniref:Putative flavo protein n=1 Tax=Absidia repens TaxID=90262 RepID=A0A1X2HZF6_9FUNG|nr:putative flavo protein [Absidia repens]